MAWQDVANQLLGGQAGYVIQQLNAIDPNYDWSNSIKWGADQLNASFGSNWQNPANGTPMGVVRQITGTAGDNPAAQAFTQNPQNIATGNQQAAAIQQAQNPPDKGLFGGGMGGILGGLALGGLGALIGPEVFGAGGLFGGATDAGLSMADLTGGVLSGGAAGAGLTGGALDLGALTGGVLDAGGSLAGGAGLTAAAGDTSLLGGAGTDTLGGVDTTGLVQGTTQGAFDTSLGAGGASPFGTSMAVNQAAGDLGTLGAGAGATQTSGGILDWVNSQIASMGGPANAITPWNLGTNLGQSLLQAGVGKSNVSALTNALTQAQQYGNTLSAAQRQPFQQAALGLLQNPGQYFSQNPYATAALTAAGNKMSALTAKTGNQTNVAENVLPQTFSAIGQNYNDLLNTLTGAGGLNQNANAAAAVTGAVAPSLLAANTSQYQGLANFLGQLSGNKQTGTSPVQTG